MKKDRYTLRIIYAILLYIIIFTGCSSNGKTQLETSIESKTHLIASEITAESIQQSSEDRKSTRLNSSHDYRTI